MYRILLNFWIFVFTGLSGDCQEVVGGKAGYLPEWSDSTGRYTIYGNDTVRVYVLPEVPVYALRVFSKRRDQHRYNKLVLAVRKAYPYAKVAGEKMRMYAAAMNDMSRPERKAMIRSFEFEVKEKYAAGLKKLTVFQGAVLLRLVDRETQFSSYQIVKELKGGLQAFFWNGVASFWDLDLRSEFNPQVNEDDLYIQEICRMIEVGALEPYEIEIPK